MCYTLLLHIDLMDFISLPPMMPALNGAPPGAENGATRRCKRRHLALNAAPPGAESGNESRREEDRKPDRIPMMELYAKDRTV